MIKRKDDWFYYYDSDKNLMGRINIKTHKFVGDTSCMIKLYDHIMMIKKQVRRLYDVYEKTGDYSIGICTRLKLLNHKISKEAVNFIKSKFPREYYDLLGRKTQDKKANWRFPSNVKRKAFLNKLNDDYGITTEPNS